MMNFKCKSHRGRSPDNRTDALCIVEIGVGITRVFATVIPDKKQETMIPYILDQVVAGFHVWIDEHRSYRCLTF